MLFAQRNAKCRICDELQHSQFALQGKTANHIT